MSVTFKSTDSTKDTGTLGDPTSIRPIENGQLLDAANLNRSADNLRVRTEELARALETSEYIVQSATNSTVLLRYYDPAGQSVNTGVLNLFYKEDDATSTKYYYVEPAAPATVASPTMQTLIVVGSSTNGFNYVINQGAFRGYYNQGTDSSLLDSGTYNKYFGLSAPGDCLALRIPTVPTGYSSEVVIKDTTSEFLPAGESTLQDTMLEVLQNGSISATDAETSLIKVPSINSITLTFSDTSSDLYQLLDTAANATASSELNNRSLTVKLKDKSNGNLSDESVELDLTQVTLQDPNSFRIPRTGYRSLETLSSLDASTHTYAFALDATQSFSDYQGVVTAAPSASTMLPKNEYLYPVAVFTGDSIAVPGLGSVAAIDIENRIDTGGALMDQTGRLVGETGTAVSTFETRTQVSYQYLSDNSNLLISHSGQNPDEYFRLPIDINIPEAGDGTPIYLDKLEMQMVLDESVANNQNLQNVQSVRAVKVSLGMYSLSADLGTFTDSGIRFAYTKCISLSDPTTQDSALSKLLLKEFDLRQLSDDYIAHVEIPDSIRNTEAQGKKILIWISRTDDEEFFTTDDIGKFRIDLRFTYRTRIAEAGVGLGRAEDLATLSS